MRRTLLAVTAAAVCSSAAFAVKLPTTQPKKPQTKPAPPKPPEPKLSRRAALIEGAQLHRQALGQFQDKAYAEAAETCRQALALPLSASLKASFHYNLTCALARLGKKADALDSLAAAVRLGWDDVDHLQKDPDLAALRGEERFGALIRKLNTGVAPKVTRGEAVTVIEGKPAGGLHYRIRMSPGAGRKAPQRLIVWLHPAGGLMNNVVERMAPTLNRHGFALMVLMKQNARSWSSTDARKMLKTAAAADKVKGLDAGRPILMGYSAGGQMALMLWARKPGRFGGLILDAAYPLDMAAYQRQRRLKLLPLPDDPAVRDVPFFVLVGTLDGGSKVWKMAQKQWALTEVPLEVHYVEGGRHAWLFNTERIQALVAWLDKLPVSRPAAPAARPRSGSDNRKGKPVAAKRTAPFGPPKRGKWQPIEAMTDEFEGTELDPRKWHPKNPQWKGRQPGYFHTKNVTVRDGKLNITMKKEDLPGLPKGYHTYTCGAVKSKTKVRYGYFEIKSRAMDSRGSSAFWFYAGTPEVWTEIDVFEIGGGAPKHERVVHMNAHVFHTLTNPDRHWSRGGKWTAPYRLADGYHVYALEWDKDRLKYYVDGVVVRTMPNTHWHQPLHLNFDSETMPKWFGLPKLDALPSTFSIEYVRAWKRVDLPPDRTMKSCTFGFPGVKAESVKGKTITYRLETDDEGKLLVLARFGGSPKPAKVKVGYENKAFYDTRKAGQIKKTVRVKDRKNRELLFAFSWSKTKGEKKNNSYRAVKVEIAPAAEPKEGTEELYELVSAEGQKIHMRVQY